MTGYTKLFGSIVASTIWREPHTVRIVWITMLAMANKYGRVEASMPGLADLSRVSLEECVQALDALQSPDPYSRTPDYEGRRVERSDGGWKILNHAKYREKMGVDERREYLRLKKQESRQRLSTSVNKRQPKSTASTHAEAEADPLVPAELLSVPGFPAEWDAFVEHRKKIRKPMAERAMRLHIITLLERPQQAVELLQAAIKKGWSGLEWKWLENSQKQSHGTTNGKQPAHLRTAADREFERTGIREDRIPTRLL